MCRCTYANKQKTNQNAIVEISILIVNFNMKKQQNCLLCLYKVRKYSKSYNFTNSFHKMIIYCLLQQSIIYTSYTINYAFKRKSFFSRKEYKCASSTSSPSAVVVVVCSLFTNIPFVYPFPFQLCIPLQRSKSRKRNSLSKIKRMEIMLI